MHAASRSCLAILGGALVAALAGATAEAASRSWNSSSAPLTLYANSRAQAQAYGSWEIRTDSSGTRSRATAYLRDPMPTDGDPVYFRLYTQTNSGYCYQPDYTSCSASWYTHASDNGGEYWASSSWSTGKVAWTGLSSSGDYARAKLHAVEEHDDLPDMLSNPSYTKGLPYP